MRRQLWIGLSLWCAACGAVPATPEQRRLAERQLLEPFVQATEVGCGELFVEMTANFHGNVGQPSFDARVHDLRREAGDGYEEKIWTNKVGDPTQPFVVTIGETDALGERGVAGGPRTKFRVVNQVRLRTWLDSRPLMLNATAGGPVILVLDAGSPRPRDVAAFTVADGVLTCTPAPGTGRAPAGVPR
jgi:hypothetical protein